MFKFFSLSPAEGGGGELVRKPSTWLRPVIMTTYTIDHGPGIAEAFLARDYEGAGFELFSRLQVEQSGGPWTLTATNGDGDSVRVEGRLETPETGGKAVLILRAFLRFGGLSGEEDFLPMPDGWGFHRKGG